MVPKEYSANDSVLAAFGKVVEGWTKFSYNYSNQVTKNYTGNNKLSSYSVGQENEEATLEVYMTQLREWEKLCSATKGSTNLVKLGPVQLAFTYLNDQLDEVTDVLTVLLTGAGRSVEGGSDGLKTEIPVTVLEIKLGV